MDKQKSTSSGSSRKVTRTRGGTGSRGGGSGSRGGRSGSFQGGSANVYRPTFSPQYQQPLPQQYPPQFYSQQVGPTYFVPSQFDYNMGELNDFDAFAMRSPTPCLRRDTVDMVDETQFSINLDQNDDEDEDEEWAAPLDEDDGRDDEEQVVAKGKFSKRAPSKDWTEAEEVALAKAWVHCSVDRKKSNQQKRDSFWKQILDHFNKQLGGTERTVHQLNSKWGTMQTQINLFNGFWIQACRLRESGNDDMNVLQVAMADFRKKHKGGFKHVEAWKVLKDNEKWFQSPAIGEESSGSDKRRKSSESGNYHAGTPDDANNINIPDLNEDTGPTRIKRKDKRSVESSSSQDIASTFQEYTHGKSATIKALAETKQRQAECAIELLKAQRDKVIAAARDQDFKTFCEPHDHLPAPLRSIAITRKLELAAKHGWPTEHLE